MSLCLGNVRRLYTHSIAQVQEQHKSGQRLKLDVILNAPEVIVPLESQSKEVVVVDLGTLTLSNTFHLTRPEAEQDPALYEQYAIKLTQLQVFRYSLVCSASFVVILPSPL